MTSQSKITFVREVQTAMTDLARSSDKLRALRQAFNDRAYNTGAKNELKVADLQTGADSLSKSMDITPEDIVAAMNFTEQLWKLLSNETPAKDAWGSVVNRCRADM